MIDKIKKEGLIGIIKSTFFISFFNLLHVIKQ